MKRGYEYENGRIRVKTKLKPGVDMPCGITGVLKGPLKISQSGGLTDNSQGKLRAAARLIPRMRWRRGKMRSSCEKSVAAAAASEKHVGCDYRLKR